VWFVSVRLLVEIFSEGVNKGVPEKFAPFLTNKVELSGVIVVFVGSTASEGVIAPIASDIEKIAPKITNLLFMTVRHIYSL